MHLLAKLGFTQSYTYFTWRNTKQELTEYLTELSRGPGLDYFRPNFFANTPDILHEYLQTGGEAAFKVRLVLAALLSPSYGIYSGYEFAENVAMREGSEEYLNSEKYELRHRRWSPEEGTLIAYIRRINEIRRSNPPFGFLTGLRFHETHNEQVLAFSKTLPDSDPILVVVNLDPFRAQQARVALDLWPGGSPAPMGRMLELLSGQDLKWQAPELELSLDPAVEPAQVLRVGA
jgi:starch synthase (maltosyl-transferring)